MVIAADFQNHALGYSSDNSRILRKYFAQGKSSRFSSHKSAVKQSEYKMPVFISYSHSDKEFVDKLATHLIKHNAHVWVDQWEIKVGESILDRVQDGIQGATAILFVLSNASVQSEWCKKEVSAGLMRELEEKSVIVLPVLLEKCQIPPFLKEKKYADFTENFDVGLKAVVDGIANITNANQGRIEVIDYFVDWVQDWLIDDNGLFVLRYILVEHSKNCLSLFLPKSLSCVIKRQRSDIGNLNKVVSIGSVGL